MDHRRKREPPRQVIGVKYAHLAPRAYGSILVGPRVLVPPVPGRHEDAYGLRRVDAEWIGGPLGRGLLLLAPWRGPRIELPDRHRSRDEGGARRRFVDG